MMRFIQKTKGMISIFLALIMLPMFTVAGLTIDGARLSAARMAVSGAGDLAMNAALSEYNVNLHEIYGLFAMSESTEELQKNVSRYFQNTINNTGLLAGSDSYTRGFINSIGSLFSSDEISFDNIVDMQVDDFKLVEVSNSALANPTVLERQIVEYMKFRGPVNLGTGLLTKIGLLGETSKQTKAIESKLKYEKKLNTVQEACETAYKAINAYNETVSNSHYNGDYLSAMESDLAIVKEDVYQMLRYYIASKIDGLDVDKLSIDRDKKNSVESDMDNKIGEDIEDKEKAKYDPLKDCIADRVWYSVKEDGTFTQTNTLYIQQLDSLLNASMGDSLGQQLKFVLDVKSNYSSHSEAYTYCTLIVNRFANLNPEQQSALQLERESYQNVINKLNQIVDAARSMPDRWGDKVNGYGADASHILNDRWYADLASIDDELKDAIDALEKVIKKAEKLESARNAWGDRVDDLSDNEIKTSMKGEYDQSARDINKEAVRSLIEVLEGNKKHFSTIKSKLEEIKIYDYRFCKEGVDSWSVNYKSKLPNIRLTEVQSVEQIDEKVSEEMKNYKTVNLREGLEPASFTVIDDEQQFYKYLKNICGEKKEEAEEQKEKGKTARKNVIEKANQVSTSAESRDDVKTGSYNEGVSSDISDAIDALLRGEDAGENTFDKTSIDGDDSEGDRSIENLSAIGSLLEGLNNIGENVRDKVYLEEYFTEMFSCYISGQNGMTTKALNGKDMTGNKFYGSEVEYILWGNDDVQKNLNNTKALIYGIRFALDAVYAFTSVNTRQPALSAAAAIAGWTGWGVPIVQSVILVAMSLAEAGIDLNYICKGESVCLYKSDDTWVTSLEGFAKAATEMVRQEAVKTIDNVFDKIEEAAVNNISSIVDHTTRFVQNTENGVIESIRGTVVTAVEKLIVKIIGESNYNLQRSDIEVRVDKMIDDLESSIEGDGLSATARREAVKALRTGSAFDGESVKSVRDIIIDNAFSAYNEMKEGTLTAISEKVENLLRVVTVPISRSIQDAIRSSGQLLIAKVEDITQKGGDLVKEQVTDVLNEYLGEFTGDDSNNPTLAAGFSMNYKEYLKTFVLMSVISKKNNMLARCAKLIQANISQKDSSFNISRAFTMTEVNAGISIKTTFFNVPVVGNVDGNGNNSYELDFSRIGSDVQHIMYTGVLGY